MWKQVATGTALLIAGIGRITEHSARIMTLEDYLAFRCGPDGLNPGTSWLSPFLLSQEHCWGCAALAIGAGILVFNGWKLVRRTNVAAWQPN